MASGRLPLEIISEVIAALVVDPDLVRFGILARPQECSKVDWYWLEPFTLMSRAVRTIALEKWFRVFFSENSADLNTFREMFQETGINWIREIHIAHPVPYYHSQVKPSWDLHGLHRLQKIRVYWNSTSLPFPALNYVPFLHVPQQIESLDIRGIPWPSPLFFKDLDHKFPNLTRIDLWQDRVWCGLCNTCQKVRFNVPDDKRIVYDHGTGLPIHYARAFASLQYLDTICFNVANHPNASLTLGPPSNKDSNPYQWSGECAACIDILDTDESFRDRWMARKNGNRMPDDVSSSPSAAIYIAPPRLQRVEWRFWDVAKSVTEGPIEEEEDSWEEISHADLDESVDEPPPAAESQDSGLEVVEEEDETNEGESGSEPTNHVLARIGDILDMISAIEPHETPTSSHRSLSTDGD